MAASAVSMEVSTSIVLRSFHHNVSSLNGANGAGSRIETSNRQPGSSGKKTYSQRSPFLVVPPASSNKTDIENQSLFKQRARPRCSRRKISRNNSSSSVLKDKTNNYNRQSQSSTQNNNNAANLTQAELTQAHAFNDMIERSQELRIKRSPDQSLIKVSELKSQK